MKLPFWCGVVLAIFLAAAPATRAQVPAVVTGDQVNVRSRPSVPWGELVTQLARGQRVIVFEEGLPAARPREAVTEWTRIELPAGSPVWVSAQHVAMPGGTVQARRLNVRAGPSEDYAILGVVAREATLRVIEQRNGWLKVEAPLGLSAYVASIFVEAAEQAPAEPGVPLAAAAPTPTPSPRAAAPPAPAPQSSPAVTAPDTPTDTAPSPVASALAASPDTASPPSDPQATSPGAAPSEPPPEAATRQEPAVGGAGATAALPDDFEISPEPRVVHREGRVRSTLSVHAPTPFELTATDSGKRLNYLLPQSTNVLIRPFRGQRVRVRGEEYLDPFWHDAPVIVVHEIRLAP